MHRQQTGRVGAAGADQVVLVLVVGKYELGNLVGHRFQQLFAFVELDLAGGDQRLDQDFDVDLVVGTVHTGRVVHRIGIDPAAGQVELDPTQCGHAKIATFTDNFGAQLISVDPHRIVGAITDIGIGLGFGLDVGADAAVEQQIHRRLQNRPNQVGRGHFAHVAVDTEGSTDLRADRDGFLLAAEDPTALADQRLVVVVPAGPG